MIITYANHAKPHARRYYNESRHVSHILEAVSHYVGGGGIENDHVFLDINNKGVAIHSCKTKNPFQSNFELKDGLYFRPLKISICNNRKNDAIEKIIFEITISENEEEIPNDYSKRTFLDSTTINMKFSINTAGVLEAAKEIESMHHHLVETASLAFQREKRNAILTHE